MANEIVVKFNKPIKYRDGELIVVFEPHIYLYRKLNDQHQIKKLTQLEIQECMENLSTEDYISMNYDIKKTSIFLQEQLKKTLDKMIEENQAIKEKEK